MSRMRERRVREREISRTDHNMFTTTIMGSFNVAIIASLREMHTPPTYLSIVIIIIKYVQTIIMSVHPQYILSLGHRHTVNLLMGFDVFSHLPNGMC